jgi:hypothetical protein
MFKIVSSHLILLLLLCAFTIQSGCRPASARAATRQAPVAAATAPVVPGADQNLTDAARLLAGLQPSPAGHYAALSAQPEWRAWQKEFDGQWTQATKDRFVQMAAWRDRELKPAVGACSTLMYPFSGPDILNAVLLFPDCERYVLFGLEQTGSMPALNQLPPERLSKLLDETRHSLNELLQRNYFITSHMLQDLAARELHGTLPLMAMFLVRMDAQLISAREMELAEDGTLRPRTPPSPEKRVASALEVVFARPGHAPQTVVYFRGDVQDSALKNRPGVLPYLQHQGSFATFLKSASYLLHDQKFGAVRSVLLKQSRLILTDDSGMPLHFMKAPDWAVTLYGKYSKPVKDFNYGYQPDMAKAFADERAVKPLTFSFGYHWEAGAASVVLAVRSTAPAVQ